MPAFVVPGLQPLIFPTGITFWEFAAFTMFGGIIMAWLTFRADGALSPAIVFHLALLTTFMAVGETPPLAMTLTTTLLYALVAGLIIVAEPILGAPADRHSNGA